MRCPKTHIINDINIFNHNLGDRNN
ncbi:unnamed protein product [Spirodela intermedia]|uniref:Uncharacterized protein n=1 Tax=Spirodela intermedia TaxID=51605 RepID=A0A7I8KSX5_SPIIN|nr:unnamed protein product [Spirodela intermedia]